MKVMTKTFEVLRTFGGSVALATIYAVRLGVTVYEFPQCGKHNVMCKVMSRWHLETFHALSTNFGDSPRNCRMKCMRVKDPLMIEI